MGAHHYQLELLPRSSANADPVNDNLWLVQPADPLISELRALLPRNTSWGSVEEFETDHEWGSDLRIWHEDALDGPVFSIVFRFSPIGDDQSLLTRVLSLAAKHDMVVRSRTREMIEPQLDQVIADLQSSPAFKLLSEPGNALLQAAEKVETQTQE